MIFWKFGNANIAWKDANWKWGEGQTSNVPVVTQPAGAPPSVSQEDDEIDHHHLHEIEVWNPYKAKKNRIVELICKVQNNQTNQKKSIMELKVSVDRVEIQIRPVKDLSIKIDKES